MSNLAFSADAICFQRPALCVDLDGTLVRSDTLVESAIRAVLLKPVVLLKLPLWLLRGRAYLKQRLAAHTSIDPKLLPYNERFVEYLRMQKAGGRQLILATAADCSIARSVANHLGLFDGVVASDGVQNLKGEVKAKILAERFGDKGFCYAGSDRSDLPIWKRSGGVVAVNASPAIIKSASRAASVEFQIDERRSKTAALLRALRPHQWVKNILVFVPIITSGAFLDWPAWLPALLTFLAFCLTASGIYLLNDLLDLEADRKHRRKCNRPLAHGDIPLLMALAPIMIVFGMAIGGAVNALWILLGYVLLSLAYSFGFKSWPLVDIFLLAALYTIRIFAGGLATKHPVSLWLLAFAGFLFFDLAAIKRVKEIVDSKSSTLPRRGYLLVDSGILQQMGIAAAFVSCLVLALYVQTNSAFALYSRPEFLWGIVPLMLFWQCRLWLSTSRGYMHDDPIIYAVHDWVSWIFGALVIGIVMLATFLRPVS